jgi:hypothetical protein
LRDFPVGVDFNMPNPNVGNSPFPAPLTANVGPTESAWLNVGTEINSWGSSKTREDMEEQATRGSRCSQGGGERSTHVQLEARRRLPRKPRTLHARVPVR